MSDLFPIKLYIGGGLSEDAIREIVYICSLFHGVAPFSDVESVTAAITEDAAPLILEGEMTGELIERTRDGLEEFFVAFRCEEAQAHAEAGIVYYNNPLSATKTSYNAALDYNESPSIEAHRIMDYMAKKVGGVTADEMLEQFGDLMWMPPVPFISTVSVNSDMMIRVGVVTMKDPETGFDVEMEVWKEQGGGMFAVDSSYLSNSDEAVHNPFSGKLLEGEGFSDLLDVHAE